MRFKIIQESEARKIVGMMESNDQELHKLAVAIINIKERVRFTMLTIYAYLPLYYLWRP